MSGTSEFHSGGRVTATGDVMSRAQRVPQYSDEERELILDFVGDLHRDVILAFMRDHELSGRSGSKAELKQNIEDALRSERLSFTDLVNLLDLVEPWEAQHVYLFDGPDDVDLSAWKDHDLFAAMLKEHHVGRYLGRKLPLILPTDITLSSIEHIQGRSIRVTAVERRDAKERIEDLDYTEEKEELDASIEYRAYRRLVTRGMVTFEWDLLSNSAFLQISQLPSGDRYEDARERFAACVSSWLELGTFQPLDLARAIRRFHDEQRNGDADTSSHGIGYATPQGRRLAGLSASRDQILLGEEGVVDDALENVRRRGGVGHHVNLYFMPSDPPDDDHPIQKKAHVMIWAGDRQRINLPTGNSETVVRHVLQRIQEACR